MRLKKFSISFLSILAIIIACLTIFFFFFAFVPGKNLYYQLLTTKNKFTEIQQSLTAKNFDQIKNQLDDLNNQKQIIQKKYIGLKIVGSLPYFNRYYRDGQHALNIFQEGLETGKIIVQAIEPYKDFLGLQGVATDSAQTTQDRITFLTESIEGIVPHLSTIENKLSQIEKELDQIDPNRYPEEFHGLKIKSNLLKAKEGLSEAIKLLKNGQPILSQASWFLGKDSPRNYLLMFQNDAELRPTGGFWTAYALIKVDKGKFTPILSEDIYALDTRYNSRVPAPRPIKAYHINVPYFNLRDLNISPDFSVSMGNFMEIYNKISPNKTKIDAVVAIDTHILVDLVKILGRVGVSGFGNFSADPDKRCDGCPQIIYQLEWLAGRPRNYLETNRKGFLGPLMNSILSNIMGSEKSKIGPLAEAFLNNIYQKHILFYFPDETMENAAKSINIAGAITPTDGDYFHLNDANMASAKTNLFLKQKIKHEITSQSNQIEHKITITYLNPTRASNCNLEKGDLCLNAPKYRDWFRFYVPTGSKLIKMTGSEVEPVQYEELGKQVFEGFYGDKFPLYAQSSIKTSIQYQSSIPPSTDYRLLLQKQPGTKAIDYEIYVNGKKYDSFSWVADKTIKIAF